MIEINTDLLPDEMLIELRAQDKRFTIKVDGEIAEYLKEIAKEYNTSKTAVIQCLVYKGIEEYKRDVLKLDMSKDVNIEKEYLKYKRLFENSQQIAENWRIKYYNLKNKYKQ